MELLKLKEKPLHKGI